MVGDKAFANADIAEGEKIIGWEKVQVAGGKLRGESSFLINRVALESGSSSHACLSSLPWQKRGQNVFVHCE
jgi:hypothetical protein